MGIGGLLTFLKNEPNGPSALRKGHVREFKGKRAGIDAYSWLHKGAYGCAYDIFRGQHTDRYVMYCMRIIKMLKDNGITPVLVFDGSNMPLKMVDNKRRDQRQKARKQASDLIAMGKKNEAYKYLVQAIEITHAMAFELMKAARSQNIDCIVAPYEADSQLAYLEKENYIDLIITEDSDLIVFGCKTIVFKMTIDTGICDIYNGDDLEKSLRAKEISFKHFNFDKFRWAAIMSGCDYINNLAGIGLAKSWRFMNMSPFDDIIDYLRRFPHYFKKVCVNADYIDRFMMADFAFKYCYVFDPILKKRVSFTTPKPDTEDFKRFERMFPDVEVDQLEFALGNVDEYNKVYGHLLRPTSQTSIYSRRVIQNSKIQPPVDSHNIDEFNKVYGHLLQPSSPISNYSKKVIQKLKILPGKQTHPQVAWNQEIEDSRTEDVLQIYRTKAKECRVDSPPPVTEEPASKRPRKCKFVKSCEKDLVASNYFFSDENKNQNILNTIEALNIDKEDDEISNEMEQNGENDDVIEDVVEESENGINADLIVIKDDSNQEMPDVMTKDNNDSPPLQLDFTHPQEVECVPFIESYAPVIHPVPCYPVTKTTKIKDIKGKVASKKMKKIQDTKGLVQTNIQWFFQKK